MSTALTRCESSRYPVISVRAEIPFHIKLILIVATLIFLIVVNPFGEEKKGKLQNDFDSWVSASSQMLAKPSDGERPIIEILLRSEIPARLFTWELRTSEANARNEKILRLLRQAREADLFRFSGDSPGEMTLEVKDQTHHFVSRFNQSDIRDNVKAMVFMQLFEEYVADHVNTTQQKKGES